MFRRLLYFLSGGGGKIRTRSVVFLLIVLAPALALGSYGAYTLSRDQARIAVDESLEARAALFAPIGTSLAGDLIAPPRPGLPVPGVGTPPPGLVPPGELSARAVAPPGLSGGLGAVWNASDRQIEFGNEQIVLPPPDRTNGVGASFADVTIDGRSFRMHTVIYETGAAAQFVRSTTEIGDGLTSIRNRLWVLGLAIGALSILATWFGSRWLSAPLVRLSEAAERIASSGDLDDYGDDFDRDQRFAPGEVGQVTRSYGLMLDALGESRLQQRQLVLDAGHELRTPLTALRTHVELLASGRLTEADTATALAAIKTETDELAQLMSEVVELATDVREGERPVAVDLCDIALAAAERAGSRHHRNIHVLGNSCIMIGQPAQLDRATSNLLDNAVKFSAPDSSIVLTVTPSEIYVTDVGPGIGEEDIERIFDRFYRSDTARTEPGSGLGLAIVAKVAQAHGGEPFARNTDTGACVGFSVNPRRSRLTQSAV